MQTLTTVAELRSGLLIINDYLGGKVVCNLYRPTLLTTMGSTMVSGSPEVFSSITIPPMARSFTGWYLPSRRN